MNCKLLIIRAIYERPNISQRDLAKKYFISLGKVNQTLKELTDEKLLQGSSHYEVTDKGIELLFQNKVESAIILATDFGIKEKALEENTAISLLEINNQKLIERQIEQLQKVGINDITIVVGYQKEKFDYLIDKFNVHLVYDKDYKEKGSLSSIYKAKEYISGKNCYISPANLYMKNNLFSTYEFEPYYNAKYIEGQTKKIQADTTVQNEIINMFVGGENGYFLSGFTYWTKDFSKKLMYFLERYYEMPLTDKFSWEEVYMRNIDILPPMYLYKREDDEIIEIDTLDDLRNIDYKYYGNGKFPIDFVSDKLDITNNEIINISLYEENLNYNCWTFNITNEKYKDNKYLLRIPNNDEIDIDYKNEAIYYKNAPIKNDIVIFDEKTGIKISIFDSNDKNIALTLTDKNDTKDLINFYKDFHNSDIKYKLNNISIVLLFEKYDKLLKAKKYKPKFIDFDLYLEEAKVLMTKIQNLKKEQDIINLSLYNINIIKNEDNSLSFAEYDNIGIGDSLDDIALFCANQNYDKKEAEKIYDSYYSLDKKTTNDKEDKQLFLYKYALATMLNVLYISYKETVSLYDTEDFQMKQYRLFKDFCKAEKSL